jgi:hypothetical protein
MKMLDDDDDDDNFKNYLGTIPGQYSIDSLQKKLPY